MADKKVVSVASSSSGGGGRTILVILLVLAVCAAAALAYLYMSASSANTTTQTSLATASASLTASQASVNSLQQQLVALTASTASQTGTTSLQQQLIDSQTSVAGLQLQLTNAATAQSGLQLKLTTLQTQTQLYASLVLCGTYVFVYDPANANAFAPIICIVWFDASSQSLQLLVQLFGRLTPVIPLPVVTGQERTWNINALGSLGTVTFDSVATTLVMGSPATTSSPASSQTLYLIPASKSFLAGFAGRYASTTNTSQLVTNYNPSANTVSIALYTTSVTPVSIVTIVQALPWTFIASSSTNTYSIPYVNGTTSGTLVWAPNSFSIVMGSITYMLALNS
jgi:flagellar basal body-associated protein FliL